MFKPFSDHCFADHSKAVLLLWITFDVVFHACLCCAVLSISCSRVVTCWERADLLALLCVFLVFVSLTHMRLDHTPKLRVRLVPLNRFKPSSNFLNVCSKAVLLLWIFFCNLCFDGKKNTA